jgi:aminoglycoside phosphotransferase (APT) family kinase protein
MSKDLDVRTAQLDDTPEARLTGWIERTLGCRVTAMERQQRWRPCWYVEAQRGSGERLSLYVRGQRTYKAAAGKATAGAFEREYRVLQVLEAEGVPVPHLYGLCREPLAIVMDRAAGRSDLSTAASDEERASVLDQYMDALARIHAIDPARFEATGLDRPQGARRIALAQFDAFEAAYRAAKRRPEPVLAFLIGWVRRNPPQHRAEVSFLVCDVAQFMFDEGRLTALLDLELAYLGDALQDLAALQFRDTSEPLGDIPRALRRYEAITGAPIDAEAFDFHSIAFGCLTPLSMTTNVTRAQPSHSVLQYLEWWITFCRVPLELIAARMGLSLPPAGPLACGPTPYDALAESLVGAIRAIPVEPGFATYERDKTADLAAFVGRAGQYGPAIYRQDQAEIEALLDARFDSLPAADAALEAYVEAAGPEADAQLVPMLYARVQRHCELFRPFLSRPTVANRLKTFAQLMAG